MTKSATMRVGVHEAKTRLSQLLRLVEGGQDVEIARDGVPIVRLVALKPPHGRTLGIDQGVFTVPDEFDDSLPDDVLEEFYK